MTRVPHFSRTTEFNTCVKYLLVYLHGVCMWLDNHISIDVDSTTTITVLPKEGFDPAPFFDGKEWEKALFLE